MHCRILGLILQIGARAIDVIYKAAAEAGEKGDNERKKPKDNLKPIPTFSESETGSYLCTAFFI